MSAVTNAHPGFLERLWEWQMLRASVRGSYEIKRAREEFLPRPDGFSAASNPDKMYDAYLMRAQYPDIVRPTISGIIGVIHRTKAEIALPSALKPLLTKCTPDGLTLEAFHRLITSEVLLQGRYGVLADVPKDGGQPYLVGYSAEMIPNWSETFHDLYVLDESRWRRTGFSWAWHQRYRVLELNEGVYQQTVLEYGPETSAPTGIFGPKLVRAGSPAAVPDAVLPVADEDVQREVITPTQHGGKPLDVLPMVIIGSRDIRDQPDEPPMIGVARSALAIYRLDADYRHQLFMSGQDTLVFSGVDEGWAPSVIGAGVWIALTNPDSKAYYVGAAGTGISALRQAIADERLVSVAEGARLFTQSNQGSRAESGEALRLRYSSEAAALVDVAKASASGLERALRYAAQLVGANPNECTVKPNLEFIDVRMTAADALALTQAWMSGGFSYDTLFANLQRGELADQGKTSQDELDLIAKEKPPIAPPPTGGAFPPTGGLPPRKAVAPAGSSKQANPGDAQP